MRRLLVAAVVGLALLPGISSARGSTPSVRIATLSNRADLISGGVALVGVTTTAPVTIDLNGLDVTSSFSRVSPTELEGLVTGLQLGANVLTATLPGGGGARLTITNHPDGGPVFSGPQLQPWKCEKGAVDAQCDKAPDFTYVYQSTDSRKSGFQPYDPHHPATDVATTTTDQGIRVPFIVRIETGYQDRDQYQISALYQPGRQWTALRPQSQFNHKLLITHGASCDVSYGVGGAPSTTSYDPAGLLGLPIDLPASIFADSAHYALAAGFGVLSTALDNSGHNCDIVTQAESLIMAKEHFVDAYGSVRYTIGTGCSGGSLAQQWIANAYPGVYQGILPTCSFPDTWSSATQVMDYHLLRAYLEHPSKQSVPWSPTQWAAVEGN